MAKIKRSAGLNPAVDMKPTMRNSNAIIDQSSRLDRANLVGGFHQNVAPVNGYQTCYVPHGLVEPPRLYPDWNVVRDQGTFPAGSSFPHGMRDYHIPHTEDDHTFTYRAEQCRSTKAGEGESESRDCVRTAEPEDVEVESIKTPKSGKEKKQPKVVLKSVRVDELEDYWYWMFDALTQKGVKTILHAWISSCHPGKQTHYPYKGNRKADASSKADAYHSFYNQGYDTAPEYWPNQEGWYHVDYTACRHLEPYHIYKNERQFLARHLLLLDAKKEDQYEYNLDKLRNATESITKRMQMAFPTDAERYLEAIYTAAQKYKDFKNPNVYIDPSTMLSIYVTSQKTYKIKLKSKKAGRDHFYGSKAKKRQVKASVSQQRQPSPSEDFVMTDIKPEVSAATSRATSPDEDTQESVVDVPQSASSNAEAQRDGAQEQAMSDNTLMIDASQAFRMKDESIHVGGGMYDNAYRHGIQFPQTWQAGLPEQYQDYWYMSAPSSASTASSFGDPTPPESEASGSYSPFAAHGFNYSSQMVPNAMIEAQGYSTAPMRSQATNGFIAGMSSTAYGPQQNYYGQNPMGTHEPANPYGYRRNSEHNPNQQCAISWG